ncbi:hypothetical protein TREES_T100015853 [Tupaia chinensis]|uniref:Uncharacterized protein n=1 Tax=Tupaia chinensis TaxID=246437 RepID=L9L1T5_TUPCH|nr:hypothetical protein TREES_T100015853 [Tupaia chinensis]
MQKLRPFTSGYPVSSIEADMEHGLSECWCLGPSQLNPDHVKKQRRRAVGRKEEDSEEPDAVAGTSANGDAKAHTEFIINTNDPEVAGSRASSDLPKTLEQKIPGKNSNSHQEKEKTLFI